MAAGQQSNVIDWNEALQQCGDDEEFLREVLVDLRTETETQLTNIAGIIQNPQDEPYLNIMRSAHLLKGAAANLMCGPLRQAAMQLEDAARAANSAGTTPVSPELQAAVQVAYTGLQQAAQNYVAFLHSIGV